MPNSGQSFPVFDSPPVVETAVGVEFSPLAKWDIPAFGLYWSTVRKRYPEAKTQYVLGRPEVAPFLMLPPVPRCQFLDRTGSRLIQVQGDRFFYNWQRNTADVEYPHYDMLRPVFKDEWSGLTSFMEAQEIGFPEVQTCEVTYVNQIEHGAGWNDLGDLAQVVTCWGALPLPESLSEQQVVALNATYRMEEGEGMLTFQLHNAVRNSDGKPVLQLALSSRGRPRSSSIDDVLQWLDLGHSTVVRSFAHFTTSRMHEIWKRKDNRWL